MANLATITTNILADSGIDDINVVVTTGSYTNPAWIVSLPWTKITGTPTTLAGYGITDAVPSNRTITINGTTLDLSANRTYNVGTVTSVAALTLGTSGTDLSSTVANSTTTPVITLNVPTASASNRGALSAADWTTFNNKQNALTNPVTGTGTTNYLPKFTGASTIGNSVIQEASSNIGIGVSPSRKLHVLGGAGTAQIQSTGSSSIMYFGDASSSVIDNQGFGSLGNTLYLLAGGAERLYLSSSGNLGLGVTPSAWFSTVKAIDISTATALWAGGNGQPALGYNVFVNTSGNLIYKTSEFASRYEQISGQHQWYTAPSGTAGNAISFTQAMTLGSNSGLSIGTPSAAPAQGLLVQGASTFSSSVTAKGDLFIWGGNAAQAGQITANSAGGGLYFGASGTNQNIRLVPSGTGIVQSLGSFDVQGAATFSSSVTANGDITSTALEGKVRITSTAGSGKTYQFISIDTGNLGLFDGTAYRLWVAGSGNVGIGTTSPDRKLGILVSPSTTGDDGINLSNGSSVFIFTRTGSAYTYRGVAANAGMIYSNSNISFLADGTNTTFHNGNGETMRITNAGNVGIGTTSPSAMLTLLGLTPFIRIERSGVNTWQIQNNNNVGTITGFSINNVTAGTIPFFINQDTGNLLLGATADNGFRLDVNGTGRFSGNVTVVSSSSSTSIGTTGQIQITSSTGLAAPAGDIYLQSVIDSATPGDRGTAFVVQTGRTSGIAERFRIASTGAATFSSGIATSGYTASSSYAAIFNGAVGIGTSTPSTTDNLTLSSSTAFNLQLTNPGTGGVTWQIGATSNDYGSGGNRLVFTYGNASANSVLTLVQSTGNVLIGTTTDASYKLDVNGTGRFSAASTDYALTLQNIQDDSQGLLVRATDNDSNLYLIRAQSSNSSTSQTWVDRFTLAKNGAANFSSSVTAATTLAARTGFTSAGTNTDPFFDEAIILGQSGNQSKIQYGNSFSSSNGTWLKFVVNSNTASNTPVDVMTMRYDGNVGIGTASPSGRLDVANTNDLYTNLVTSGNNTSSVLSLFNSTGVTDGAAICYNVAMRFGTVTGLNGAGFSERMRITSGGNVLINQTGDDGYKLSVNGVSRSKGEAILGDFSNLTDFGQAGMYATNSSFADGFGSLVLSSRADAARPIIFTTSNGTSATERMRITSGGNVLIGTQTTPTPVSGVAFPLTVSSSAATRIRIDSTNASPNSGVGLYANGVQKFSFAMYGTDSDFTIYNDALLAPALTVKGTNSNVLIGTTTDSGYKLRVNGVGFFDQGIRTGNPYGSTTNNVLIGRFLTETASVNGSIRVQIGTRYYNIAAQDLGEVPS